MAVVRWGRADFEAPPTYKVRWGRADFEGTAPVLQHVRWGRADFEGVAAVVVAPLLNLTDIEPETLVTITPVVTSGQTPEMWQWRRISGPVVTLSIASGGVVTFRAPQLVLGVVATAGGVASIERTLTIDILPQVRWAYTGSGWVGQRPTVPVV
jgi:hypothetical protein